MMQHSFVCDRNRLCIAEKTERTPASHMYHHDSFVSLSFTYGHCLLHAARWLIQGAIKESMQGVLIKNT